MRTKLYRKQGYWATGKGWVAARKGKPVILHEDEQCPPIGSKRHHIGLPSARVAEKDGLARLCKRCGGMK